MQTLSPGRLQHARRQRKKRRQQQKVALIAVVLTATTLFCVGLIVLTWEDSKLDCVEMTIKDDIEFCAHWENRTLIKMDR